MVGGCLISLWVLCVCVEHLLGRVCYLVAMFCPLPIIWLAYFISQSSSGEFSLLRIVFPPAI